MANDYKAGKFNGTLQGDFQGDKTKSTVTLGDDYDTALNEVKKMQKEINSTLKSIKSTVTAIDNIDHGKGYNQFIANLKKSLIKIENLIDSYIHTMSTAVTAAQKEEWKYYKNLMDQWAATQQSNQ